MIPRKLLSMKISQHEFQGSDEEITNCKKNFNICISRNSVSSVYIKSYFKLQNSSFLLFIFCLLLCEHGFAQPVRFSGGNLNSNRRRNLANLEIFTFYLLSDPLTWRIPENVMPESVQKIKATLDGGDPLPDWLVFDSSIRTFTIYPREKNKDDAIVKLTPINSPENIDKKLIIIRTRKGQKALRVLRDTFELTDDIQSSDPNFALLRNGSIFAIWDGGNSIRKKSRIYAAIFDDEGNVVVKKSQINTDPSVANAYESTPIMKAVNNENIMMIWEVLNGSYQYLYMKVIDSDANTIQPSIALSSHLPVGLPETLSLPNGNTVIVYTSSLSGRLIVYHLSASDYSVLNSFTIKNFAADFGVKAISLTTGNILVTSQDYQPSSDAYVLKRMIINPEGTITVPSEIISQVMVDFLQENQLVTLSSGVIGNVWSGGANNNIYLSLIDPVDGRITTEVRVNVKSFAYSPAAYALPNDCLLIVWVTLEKKNEYYIRGVFLKVLTSESFSTSKTEIEFLTKELLISRNGGDPYNPPHIFPFSANEVLISWDTSFSYTQNKIYLSIYSHTGDPVVPEYVVVSSSGSTIHDPVFTGLMSNKVMVGWQVGLGSSIQAKILSKEVVYNAFPEAVKSISDRKFKKGDNVEIKLETDLFSDYDTDDITYRVNFSRYTGLYYDSQEFKIRGTVDFDGVLQVTVIGEDPYGGRAFIDFTVSSSRNLIGIFLLGASGLAFVVVMLIWIAIRRKRMNETQRRHFSRVHRRRAPSGRIEEMQEYYHDTSILQLDPEVTYIAPGIIQESMLVSEQDQSQVLPQENSTYILTLEPPLVINPVIIPDTFQCPISREIMSEPVLVISGDQYFEHTYEHLSIIEWFKTNKQDPMTRGEVSHVVFNTDLKKEIEEFLTSLTTKQILEDGNLRNDLESWVRKRGRENLLKDERLKCIVKRLDRAKLVKKAQESGGNI